MRPVGRITHECPSICRISPLRSTARRSQKLRRNRHVELDARLGCHALCGRSNATAPGQRRRVVSHRVPLGRPGLLSGRDCLFVQSKARVSGGRHVADRVSPSGSPTPAGSGARELRTLHYSPRTEDAETWLDQTLHLVSWDSVAADGVRSVAEPGSRLRLSADLGGRGSRRSFRDHDSDRRVCPAARWVGSAQPSRCLGGGQGLTQASAGLTAA